MSERAGLEFTGERVVPGLVDADLLNEHLARYRFAARFAEGAIVLDAGCGTGYGAAEFSRASSVVGMDGSAEAVGYARCNFARAGVHFLRAVCESLPFADGSFDLVAAFEVIEHLERWQDFLAEARRVLRPAGLLLVSTPNKAYYAEARGESGTLIACTPMACSLRAPSISRDASMPLGGTISTIVTNSPRAIRAPRAERSASGAGSMTDAASCERVFFPAEVVPSTCACTARSAPRIARMCAGVVPQQPPMMVAPARAAFRAKLAMYSGEVR